MGNLVHIGTIIHNRSKILFIELLLLSFLVTSMNSYAAFKRTGDEAYSLFPANNATDVNPDTRLIITFKSGVVLGNKGMVRVYDAETKELVDSLDMSIAPGPRNTRTPAPYDTMNFPGIPDKMYTVYDPDTDTSHVYQLNYVGGNDASNARHFYPILIHENIATICLHNNHLDYNKNYYVTIDSDVFPFPDGRFEGIGSGDEWTFSTKKEAPPADADYLLVSADGTGDFSTVQGAIDFIPENNVLPRTIYIRNGKYEEMVILKNRHHLTVIGEDRDKTIIRYATNGVFNRRRYEFTAEKSNDLKLVNFTTESIGVAPAQAEGLLVKGERIQVHNVTVLGSGDAVQAGGTIYMSESSIRGFGDNVLGYGIYFNRCDFISTYGPHLWARNDDSKPGYVLKECKLYGEAGVHGAPYDQLKITYARAPIVSSYSYPYTEAILLNCAVADLRPEGFGLTTFACEDARCWEYNTVNLSDGSPVDYSQRAAYARQLNMEDDAEIIANYSDPAYVLGWTPEYAPQIFSKHDSLIVKENYRIELKVGYAVAPSADFQWYKDGVILEDQTEASIIIDKVAMKDAGDYSLRIKNYLGYDSAQVVNLAVSKVATHVISREYSGSSDRLKIYPNPSKDILHFGTPAHMRGELQISIFDSSGKEVSRHKAIAGKTDQPDSIDVTELRSGLYLIVVQNNNDQYSTNFVKRCS